MQLDHFACKISSLDFIENRLLVLALIALKRVIRAVDHNANDIPLVIRLHVLPVDFLHHQVEMIIRCAGRNLEILSVPVSVVAVVRFANHHFHITRFGRSKRSLSLDPSPISQVRFRPACSGAMFPGSARKRRILSNQILRPRVRVRNCLGGGVDPLCEVINADSVQRDGIIAIGSQVVDPDRNDFPDPPALFGRTAVRPQWYGILDRLR